MFSTGTPGVVLAAALLGVTFCACAQTTGSQPSVTMPSESPMTFQQTSDFFGVYANGDITADTPAQFSAFVQGKNFLNKTVVFNSLGGDLMAGVSLGREIRKLGWNTNVGAPNSGPLHSALSDLIPEPGICGSACTFAFIGGVQRTVAPGSQFGVHRFSGGSASDVQQETEKLAGVLVAYIREMGVSADMFTWMTMAGPNGAVFLEPATMTRLNITTHSVVQAQIQDFGGHSVLNLTEADSGGAQEGRIAFYCNGPVFMARTWFLQSSGPFNSAQFEVSWKSGTSGVPVPAQHYSYRGVDNGKIFIDIEVTPALLSGWILPASSLEVDVAKKEPPGTPQFPERDIVGPLPSNFRTLIQTLSKSCSPGA